MKDVILSIADIINRIHDVLIETFGFQMSDKDLHFWIIGIIGLFTFFIVLAVFTLLSKLKFSVTILSFIYSFTVMVVLVFAIELQQAITNRGNMEFADAVIGLWGFIVFFIGFIILALLVLGLSKLLTRKNKSKLFY
ncbi:hypothetical protein [Radiobacillus deserti]|uniref:Uncharacterized protein n=1 Tax=Radiobacillus deserti TaxID=2594883 RepID=A0A516KIJ1_9BACI|nr:hypothetical protein [Radiobacillus deserti]QDP41218.1 hypothetical protein FN924_14120 [Radiobacillus deserti]